MGRKTFVKELADFKKAASAKIPIEKMILFGSRAGGKAKPWSDFDVLLVSKTFAKKKSFERPVGLHKFWKLDYPVDFLCYSPEEFRKLQGQVTIVQEAVRNGVEIR